MAMSIDEAAAVLGVSGSKVRQLCQQRKINHYRVGRTSSRDAGPSAGRQFHKMRALSSLLQWPLCDPHSPHATV